jgi:N-acetyl-D-muramate 6-phosphate phosphatase
MTTIKTVFFDLDGTLLDTAPDLATAMNSVLASNGKSPVDFSEFRYHVYGGSQTMIQFAFNIDESYPEYPIIKHQFLEIYRNNLCILTELFPGMAQVLDFLEQKKIPWGVVTSKPAWLTEPLLNHLGLKERCCCIVSGDTIPQRKPNPEPLLYACQLAHLVPQQALYIGDTEADAKAALSAKMPVGIVRYGYREKNSLPESWNADFIVETPAELIHWICKKNGYFPEITAGKPLD